MRLACQTSTKKKGQLAMVVKAYVSDVLKQRAAKKAARAAEGAPPNA